MNNVQKTILIGFGTGRSGSTTLSNILSLQKCCNMSHESRPLLPWLKDVEMLKFKIQQMVDSNERFTGDVGMYYLPYIEDIMSMGLNVKCIYLERSVDATVSSFLLKTKGKNHWAYHSGKNFRLDPEWDPCFPKYPYSSKEDALRQYVSDYHIKANWLIKKYPNKIYKLMTDRLSEHEVIRDMLKFCGFNEIDMTIETIHSNKTREKQKYKFIPRLRSGMNRLIHWKK